MKKILRYAIFVYLLTGTLFPFKSFSQTNKAVVAPKTLVYKRAGLEKNDFKATFRIVYPRVKISGNKAIEQKIIKSLDYEKVFDYSLNDEINKFSSLENVYYKLNYNKNGFLDIGLFMETLGAYPWSTKEYLVFDLKTGEKVNLSELFDSGSTVRLTEKIKTAMRRELKQEKISPENAFTFKDGLMLENLRLNDLGIFVRRPRLNFYL